MILNEENKRNNTKILLSFFDELEASKIESILKMLTKSDVAISNNYNDSIDLYKNNAPEFVILDHKTKNGNFFFEDILKINSQQKIILVSDTLRCPISCDECLNNFKFLRQVKPIDYKQLIPFLNNESVFECSNKHRFDSVATVELLSELLYVKDNLVYNQKHIENDKLVLSSKENKYDVNFMLREYELIEDIISNGFFKIKLLADSKIEIENI